MSRKNYRGHPRSVIDAWFSDSEPLDRYASSLYYFDPEAPKRVLEFFRDYLVHLEGAYGGKPLLPEEWQYRFLRDAFGWKRKLDGARKHRVIYVEIPRGNGKSTLGAGIALYLLCADRENSPKIFSAGADKEQAGIIFNTASMMVQESKELKHRCEPFKSTIYTPHNHGVYRVLSGVPRKSGLNASGVIFDELHEQPNRKLVDILHTSTVKRKQPLEWYFTTAGSDLNTICGEYHELARKVRAGQFDVPTLLPVIYAADEKSDDWTSEETARKANPNYGISVDPGYLKTEVQNALHVPAYQNTYKRFHLNIWTRQHEAWMTEQLWDPCGEPFDIAALAGLKCYGGLDLSDSDDLSSFNLCFPVLDRESGIFHFFSRAWFWLPGDNIRKLEEKHGLPYGLWEEQGFITLTDGDLIDYDCIRSEINRQNEIYAIEEVAIDRWNATQIVTQLAGDGLTVFPFGQGFASMSGPTRQLMDTARARTYHHGGNPILREHALNVMVRTDAAGGWKPDKEKSKKKIDGAVAAIMALGRASLHVEDDDQNEGVMFV